MKFEDLPKQARLLVYMHDNEAENHSPFTIADDGVAVIESGITKNKMSLSSMLNILANKGYIEHNGYCGWLLTEDGHEAALIAINSLDDDVAIPYFNEAEQPQDSNDSNEEEFEDTEEQPTVFANAAMKTAFESMAKSFEAMSKSFAALSQMYS